MTSLHPIPAAQLAAAQAFDPRNFDDAEYIAAHPSEFDAVFVNQARVTLGDLRS